MGRTHKEQLELKKEIDDASSKVTVGANYWHYKGKDKIYRVIGLGFLEANDETMCYIPSPIWRTVDVSASGKQLA